MTNIKNPIEVIESNCSWQSEFLKISEFMKLILEDNSARWFFTIPRFYFSRKVTALAALRRRSSSISA